MKYLVIVFFQVCALNVFALPYKSAVIMLISPNKQLVVSLYLNNGHLTYSLAAQGQTVLEPAALGMVIDHLAYGSAVKNIRLKRPSLKQIMGANTYEYKIEEGSGTWCLHIRLFDNGFAFRYLFEGHIGRSVNQENTSFKIPKDTRVWFFERDNDWKLKSYAGLWMNTDADSLSTISKMGPIQGKPLVMRLPGNQYMLLSEAALYQYSGMRFQALKNRELQVNFTEGTAGFKIQGPILTPWRVVLIATNLNELVNNRVIQLLNPKPDARLFKNRTYIQPGKSVWSWISKDEHYMEPANEIAYINAASSLRFEYSLIDEGWESKWPDKWRQLNDICEYAAKKKVKIWVWKHSEGLRNMNQRDSFLDSLVQSGVVGLKTDFMNSEAKSLIDFEIDLLKACAKRRLMVDFHGCQSPTGESATYPNEMTREGIRGMELNTMNEPIPAWHNAALPFTRFITGHGDYTPGFFSNKGNTSYTHQLALLYLFDSPFQCIAESPIMLVKEPKYKAVLPFLRELPTTWDETIVLPGSSIGRLAAFARRKGNVWYVAVINGTEKEVEFHLSPGFLAKNTVYKASIVTDAIDGKGFKSIQKLVQLSNDLVFNLHPTGGLVIKLQTHINR